MKTKAIFTVSLMAILATGVIAPALQEAYALKADNSEKLSPKAFGKKTIVKMNSDGTEKKHTDDKKPLKKQMVKDIRKQQENQRATEFMKTYYWKLG